jgi:hypothetical protein
MEQIKINITLNEMTRATIKVSYQETFKLQAPEPVYSPPMSTGLQVIEIVQGEDAPYLIPATTR